LSSSSSSNTWHFITVSGIGAMKVWDTQVSARLTHHCLVLLSLAHVGCCGCRHGTRCICETCPFSHVESDEQMEQMFWNECISFGVGLKQQPVAAWV
jgi:hypothetical protein